MFIALTYRLIPLRLGAACKLNLQSTLRSAGAPGYLDKKAINILLLWSKESRALKKTFQQSHLNVFRFRDRSFDQ